MKTMTPSQAMYLKHFNRYARRYGARAGLHTFANIYGEAGVEALRATGKLAEVTSSAAYINAEAIALQVEVEKAARS